jgi:hypothetical protein
MERIMRKTTSKLNPATPTSAAFKLWFRGSKIKDGSKPLIVYHGTDDTFDTFDRAKSGKGPSKLGFWFTDLPEFAKNYGKTQMACYLNVTNPKKLTQTQWNNVREKHGGDADFFSALRDKLIGDGYDGIVVKGTAEKVGKFDVRNPGFFAAFYPRQIKSVNSRDWDVEKLSIYENPGKVKMRRSVKPKRKMGKVLKFPKLRRNPPITLSGPQIREILRWEGLGGQISDARIGIKLKEKGIVKAERASITHRGFTKSKIIFVSTELGCRVSKLLHSRTDLPSWRSQVDWSKVSVTISER